MYNTDENGRADVESLYFKDKREIKKSGNTVGTLLSVCQGLTFVLGIGTSVVFMLAKYVFKVDVFNNVNVLNLVNVLLVAAGLLLSTVITVFLCREKPANVLKADRPKKGLFLGSVLLAFGANALCNTSSAIVKAVLTMLGLPVSETPQNNGAGIENYFVSVLCIAVAPALIEEFVFRGFVLQRLRRGSTESVAILISALLFGLIHGNMVQAVFAFGLGLVFAFITVKTGSIWPAVVAHFMNNFVSVNLDFLDRRLLPTAQQLVRSTGFIGSLVLCLLGVLLLVKKDPHYFQLKRTKKEYSTSSLIKWTLKTPGMIVFMVLCAVEIIFM